MLTVFWSVSEIFLFRNYVIHWTEVRLFKVVFIYKSTIISILLIYAFLWMQLIYHCGNNKKHIPHRYPCRLPPVFE